MTQTLTFKSTLLALSLSLALAGCGGSGEGSHSETDAPSNPPVAPPAVKPEDILNERLNEAFNSGSAAKLIPGDQISLLKWALSTAETQRYGQKTLLSSLYQDQNSQPLQPVLKAPNDASLNLYPIDLNTGIPFAMGDAVCDDVLNLQAGKGCGLGVLNQLGKGRVVAYGQEMFYKILKNNADFVQFAPVMNNSLRWLMTGDAHQAISKPLNVVVRGTDPAPVKEYFNKQLGTEIRLSTCDVLNSANTCWEEVDLIVLGQNIESAQFDRTLIDRYLAAGKPIYFQGSAWDIQPNTQKVFKALGIQANHNWFRAEGTLVLSKPASIEARWQRINQIEETIQTLKYFIDPASINLSGLNANHPLIKSILLQSAALQQLNGQGLSAFSAENKNGILKALVLVADLWRPTVNYTGLNKNGNAQLFMQTYASDAWLDYKRNSTTISGSGAGDYMPAEAQYIPVSNDWETLTVTIPQEGGVTAIGRASIPGKAVQIEIVDAQGANLSVQTSYLRSWGNPFDDRGYQRPLRPNSYSVRLLPQNNNTFISPFGGPLMLNYNGATPGSIITLRVKGSARYAHYDFTQAISDSDINTASAALQSKTFGWNTFKFVGGEIQQTTRYALESIGKTSPRDYIQRIKTVIYDSNHIANGYNNMPLDASTQQRCTALEWDCTGPAHRAPGVQHFIGWIATCGFLCSGNPSDGSTGVDIGWGWVHELGHNTVQGVLSMTFKSTKNGATIGCGGECDNNILAGLSMLRKYEIYGLDNNGDNFHHPRLYSYIKDSRDTGLSGEALRAEMENRLWQGNDNAKQAFHLQLAHLYTQLRQGKAQPDSQGVFEFMRLLNISQRLYNQMDLTEAGSAQKNKLGLGAFTNKDLSRPDLVYVLSSKIIGYDLKEVFKLYGLPVTTQAHTSIAMLNLPQAPLNFYAQPVNRSNHLNEGTWLALPTTGPVPAYPY